MVLSRRPITGNTLTFVRGGRLDNVVVRT